MFYFSERGQTSTIRKRAPFSFLHKEVSGFLKKNGGLSATRPKTTTGKNEGDKYGKLCRREIATTKKTLGKLVTVD